MVGDVLRNFEFKKALCDSEASITLMPLSVVRRLSLGELTPTAMTLQMADRTMAQLEGVLQDRYAHQGGKIHFPCGLCSHEHGRRHKFHYCLEDLSLPLELP